MAEPLLDLSVMDFSVWNGANLNEFVVSADLSWTMDAASQLTLEIYDPDFSMLRGYFFQVRRTVVYYRAWEIAAWEVSQSQGAGALHRIECRPIEVQAMKRDKNPSAVSGATATEYAQIQAANFGLRFQGEQTAKGGTIVQASGGSSSDENVWNVIQRLASEAGFVCFEMDSTLYFASEQWLLGKYGMQTFVGNTIFLFWRSVPAGWTDLFPLVEMPQCRQSDDDPRAAEFTAIIERVNGKQLRPGMTVTLDGVNGFNGRYLISEVSYKEGVDDPVSITARTLEKPRDIDGQKQPDTRESRT